MNELICNECKEKITTNMNVCPNCGCPISYSIDNNELLIEEKNQYCKIKLYFDFFEYTGLLINKRKTINTIDISDFIITPNAITGSSIYDTLIIVLQNNKKIKQQIHKKNLELWNQAIENWRHYKLTQEKDKNYYTKKISTAENIYIEAEGNKVKAIKLLKDKLAITNDDALDLINQIYKKYENNDGINISTSENEENKIGFNSIMEELSEIKKNNNNLQQIKQPKVQAISSSSQKSLLSTGIRGLLGSIIAGPFGLVVGAVSGKNKTKTTFVKKGIFGNTKIVTAKNNSRKFKKLAKKCK